VPPASSGKRIEEIIPPDQNKFFDMFALIRELVDADSLFELKKLFAPEVITAFARIDGKPVGIVASQPKHKGGVLFVDSADKAAASSGSATRSGFRCSTCPTSPAS